MGQGSNQNRSKRATVTAGAGGIGGGTLVTHIAQQLPEESYFKPALTYSAPTIALIGAVALTWVIREVGERFAHWDLNSKMQDARKVLEGIRDDPNSSEEARRKASQEIMKLDEIKMSVVVGKVESARERFEQIGSVVLVESEADTSTSHQVEASQAQPHEDSLLEQPYDD